MKTPLHKKRHGLFHNPGYDFYRAIWFIKRESKEVPQKLIAPYFRPVLAAICACACAEGYVHSCAQRIDRDWKPEKYSRESFRRRLHRAYDLVSKTPSFSTFPLKDLMDLFGWRVRLVHPVLHWEERLQKKPVRDVFDELTVHFPIDRTLRVIEAFRKQITKDFGLRDTWSQRSTNLTIYDISESEA